MNVDRLLETYSAMDKASRTELLASLEAYMKSNKTVTYKGESYHLIDDLAVDLEAACKPKVEITHLQS
jgi:hypothetical protein